MPKIKNKFIIFIILLITFIIWASILKPYLEKKDKRFSYVELIQSGAILNEELLQINKKEKLSIWDIIKTTWENALAVIEWWDGSITRLWWNSSIRIDELYISSDNSAINIWFELLEWKSWSNVVSFLWESSYFKEYFRDTEAAVRWTVFNVDLDKDYLYVTDHKVTLTKSDWNSIIIEEKQPLSLLDYKFIDFSKFIMQIKDKNWENFNYKVDIEFLNGLKEQIYNDLDDLLKYKDINLDEVLFDDFNKKRLYNELLWEYQKLNFIKSDNAELFQVKLELKNTLIKLSDWENKTKLIENTLYDLKDTIESKKYWNLNLLLPIFTENKENIWDIDLKKYFKNNIIPEDLKNILIDDFSEFIDIFWVNLESIKNIDIKNINDKANSVIHDGLDKGVEKIGNLFNK